VKIHNLEESRKYFLDYISNVVQKFKMRPEEPDPGSDILGCFRKSTASRLRDMILLLCSALLRHIWSAVSSSRLPSTTERGTYWSETSEGPQK